MITFTRILCSAALLVCVASAKPSTQPAASFSTAGHWDHSSLPGHRPDRSTIWTAKVGAAATWNPNIDAPVRVRIALHKIVHKDNNDPRVRIDVVHGGKTDTQYLDFTQGQTDWVDLGTFDFAGRGGEFVRATKVGKQGALRISAARFDLLGDGANGGVIQSFTIDDITTGKPDPTFGPPKTNRPRDPGPPKAVKWEATFKDDFEGDAIDTSVWSIEAGSPGHIISSRWPENVLVKDGLLSLGTRKEQRGGKEWTTGNVWTKSFRQKYGYFECRMRIGAASGLNNAFWLMTTHKPTDPMHFEIDIAEGKYPHKVHVALHNWSGEHKASGKQHIADEDLSADFHVYGLEWNERELIWYLDGQEIHRLPHDFCHDVSPLRLSSAVGTFAGHISDALDGTHMDVDWVRVYRKVEEQK